MKHVGLRTVTLTIAGAALLLGMALFGGLYARQDDSRSAPASAVQAPLAGDTPGRSTPAQVRQLEQRVAANRADHKALVQLGLLYQQRARETGDPGWYSRSEDALRRAGKIGGDEYLIATGLASLAASRHEFRDAARLASRAIEMSPNSAAPHGVLGDAQVELGDYKQAFASYNRMATIKPNLASYARVSYWAELMGDDTGAVLAMEEAVNAASSVPEHASWALVQLGNLHFGQGRLMRARRAYAGSLGHLPGYPYALAGLARIDASSGRHARAISQYRQALDAMPLPEFAIGLHDAARAGGDPAEAQKAVGLIDAMQRLLEANGVRSEAEIAAFDADRGAHVQRSLATIQRAYEDRRSIDIEDALAWALYRNGNCAQARVHSVRALRLGTRDARKFFHRGMIERCLGNRDAARTSLARALEINPYFSVVDARVATRLAR